MRKIVVSNFVSVDGFIAGPDDEIDWFVNLADKEFERYSVDLISSVDTMLFGRITYQLMESYWPAATSATDDQGIIDAMNNSLKIVFSKTLKDVHWKNSRLIKDNLAEESLNLKRQPGKDMIIYGSGTIVSALSQEKLIDDYRIIVCPVVLGKGKMMFNDIRERINLKLIDIKTFASGIIVLHYQPDLGN